MVLHSPAVGYIVVASESVPAIFIPDAESDLPTSTPCFAQLHKVEALSNQCPLPQIFHPLLAAHIA